MVVGQHGKEIKVGAIIQARMASTRLPGKVLLSLPSNSGISILKRIIESAKSVKSVSFLSIATSKQEDNNPIELLANNEGILCYRGDEDDVLSRFIKISEDQQLDTVIRLTGDNPLLAIKELEEVLYFHQKNKNDYTKSVGLPLGMNFEIVDAKALIDLKNKKLTKEDKEHVTKYINDNSSYKKEVYEFKLPELQELRCTVDYPSDFAMLNLLMQNINLNNVDIIDELNSLVYKMPWIKEINNQNHQVYCFNKIEDELPVVISALSKYGLFNTLNYLNKSLRK